MPKSYGTPAPARPAGDPLRSAGVLLSRGALQQFNLRNAMQNMNIGTSSQQRTEEMAKEAEKMAEWERDRSLAFQARKEREERELEERKIVRKKKIEDDIEREKQEKKIDDIEREKQENEWRREIAGMWTEPGLSPLAQPPILIGKEFWDTFMPSDLRFRRLFPNSPEKRCRMKDLMGEHGALSEYSEWAHEMVPSADAPRREFYERLASDSKKDGILVFLETCKLMKEAGPIEAFEFFFCDDVLIDGKLGTEGLKKRLLESGPLLWHESGLYHYKLEENEEPGRKKVWETHGHLVPTELEKFEHIWVDKDGDTTRLESELEEGGAAVFGGWDETITQKYSHLLSNEAERFDRWIQQSWKHGNTAEIKNHMMLLNDAYIESLGELFLQKYGHLIRPSLDRFRHQHTPERIEYIRIWEPQRLNQEWGPEILAAYPLYTQLELFEHRHGSKAYEKGDQFSIDYLKDKLLRVRDAESLVREGGAEAFRKYGHLIPKFPEEEKFERECMERGEDGKLRANNHFMREGKRVFDGRWIIGGVEEGWSSAIKEKYMCYAPTDLQQFHALKSIKTIEHELMMYGENLFENGKWDEEVREKWGPLCPTDEARFEYNYCESDDGVLKANEEFESKREDAYGLDSYPPHIKDKYFRLFGFNT